MANVLAKAPREKAPRQTPGGPAPAPREVQAGKIAVMEAYLLQLQNRGAPASEILQQQAAIAREQITLSLLTG